MRFILEALCIFTSVFLIGGTYHDLQEDRWVYPEFKYRAQNARNESRTLLVEQTLKAAAGVYRNKTGVFGKGLEKTVFVSVVAYNERSFYKLYFHNLLCFTQHHNIDIVVYLIHHNLAEPDLEIQQLRDVGIKVLTYPDELFWTLLYSKTTEAKVGTGKGDYLAKVPSFTSHGALVMLVPVLESLLHGYNVIFTDVDIALVVDPVPYLTRGRADFVSTIEMRGCPDHYTPTYSNHSAHAHGRKGHARTKSSSTMDNKNWYTIEPNTGTMHVRSTEAAIGFYTQWLLRIVSVNEVNDQKALLRDPDSSVYVRDCLHGHSSSSSSGDSSSSSSSEGSDELAATPGAAGMSPKTVAGTGMGMQTESVPLHNRFRRSHLGPHHTAHDAHTDEQTRIQWLGNFTTLVADVTAGRFRKPVKFCFLSEILFQNGQTALICGVKPSFKDSWILEMNKHGLQRTNLHGEENLNPHDENAHGPRYPVTVHANFCNKKTHELNVRGLWLVRGDSPDYSFNQSTCRAYLPQDTFYGKNNWTEEARLVRNKRKYMYDTFVVPGGLIQSTNEKEVYLLDENLRKQLIPDGDTFIAKFGENAWGKIRQLPSPIMDLITLGPAIPSVKNVPLKKEEVVATATPSASPTAAFTTAKPTAGAGTDGGVHASSTAPPSGTFQPGGPAFEAWYQSVTRARAKKSPMATEHTAPLRSTATDPSSVGLSTPGEPAGGSRSDPAAVRVPPPPPDFTDSTVHRGNGGGYTGSKTITPGMLVRSPSTTTVYFIDKGGARRMVPNLDVFVRLFGNRLNEIVTVSDKALQAVPTGQPLL